MDSFQTGTGFSIELIKYRLEYRGEHKGLALYEALGGKVTDIAIVEKPATNVGAILNSFDQTIQGPVIIPDLKTLRTKGPHGRENCYWFFSAETIKHLQKSFSGTIKIGH